MLSRQNPAIRVLRSPGSADHPPTPGDPPQPDHVPQNNKFPTKPSKNPYFSARLRRAFLSHHLVFDFLVIKTSEWFVDLHEISTFWRSIISAIRGTDETLETLLKFDTAVREPLIFWRSVAY